MEPVERVKFTQQRFKFEALEAFLTSANANYTQHHAYGMNNCNLSSGANIQIDFISTTAESAKIAQDIAVEESKENS